MVKFLSSTCVVINRYLEYALSGLGIAMALVVATQVFFRYILNNSLFWSEELARYILVWISFLGATVAYYSHLHPGVDVITSRLSLKRQRRCRLLVHIIAIAFSLVMIISGIQFAWFVRLQISPALAIHKWIILAVIPLSGVIFLVYSFTFFLRTLQQDQP